MKKNNKKMLQDRFDQDGLTLPPALEIENLKKRLPEKMVTLRKSNVKRNTFTKMISAAACLALVVTCLYAAVPHGKNTQDGNESKVDTAPVYSQTGALPHYADYNQLKAQLQKMDSSAFANVRDTVKADTLTDSAAVGSTYIQVDGVDESDLLRNDGAYLYAIDGDQQQVLLYSTAQGKAEKIATLAPCKALNAQDKTAAYLTGIYQSGNRLAVQMTVLYYEENRSETRTETYDITDRKAPKLLQSYAQSGDYLTSRKIGNTIYTVSNTVPRDNSCKRTEDYVPYAGPTDHTNLLPAEHIGRTENPAGPNTLVITAVSLATGNAAAAPKSVLGCGATVYCNQDRLYIAAGLAESNEKDGVRTGTQSQTQLICAALSDKEIAFTATCDVDGSITDSYAMDARDSQFRVVTTRQTGEKAYKNTLYIFNEQLQPLGKVTDFAKDETVKAVRFTDDTAYVITYRQTDPLFCIDLTQPTAPKITGSVKIDGFSSHLLPLNKTTLLGIGYATQWGQYGEEIAGLKLALFDVTNGTPRVLDSQTFTDRESEAQYDPHAICYNRANGTVVLPYTEYNAHAGILQIKDRNGKLQIRTLGTLPKNALPVRCTYIGSTYYTLDQNGKIYTVPTK